MAPKICATEAGLGRISTATFMPSQLCSSKSGATAARFVSLHTTMYSAPARVPEAALPASRNEPKLMTVPAIAGSTVSVIEPQTPSKPPPKSMRIRMEEAAWSSWRAGL